MDNYSIDNILRERYLLPEENSWSDLAKRVSGLYPDILPYIESKIFVPGSPTLMNACTDGKRVGTLSSCFPMGITDSMDGIMDAMKEAAMVTKMCGGVGYDFSVLRGSNEMVKTVGKPSGGVLCFIGIYSAIIDGVRQGSARRGAGMSLLKCIHPDILKFISAKLDLKKYNRTNFSVKLDHDFYKHLEKNPKKVFKTKNVVDGKENNLTDKDGTYTYEMVWNKIIESAWRCGEPGIFNESYVSERSTLTHICDTPMSNPCSEFCVTVPYLSCCLASINLSKLVKDKQFDWVEFGKIIGLATRFLNAVIDKNVYPIKKIEEATLKARAIGLGIMGLSHMFFKLGIPYDSDEAKELTKDIMLYETLRSMKESVEMAKESKPFEWFNYDVFMKANHRLFRRKQIMDIDVEQLQEDIKKHGCYNSSQTSVAPTGSISTLAETSSGIEPVFGLVHIRKVETGDKEYSHMLVIDPVFKERVESKYSDDKDKIYEYVSKHSGSCQGCDYLSKADQKVFKVAADIEPMRHLDILEATSMKTSLSVSKTINLPSSATTEDISKIYLEAYKRGIIGVTVYRDGCREGILVHETNGNGKGIERKEAPKRPQDLECDVHHVKVGKDHLVVLAGKLKGKLYEVFVAKTEKELAYDTGTIRKEKRNHYDFLVGDKVVIDNLGKNFGGSVERTLARFISMGLRSGVALTLIVEQLTKGDDFFSFDIAVSRVLKKYIKNGEVYEADVCDVCKSKLIYYDGCIKCSNCTWTKCG